MHVIHRGNNRGRIFFAPEDRRAFIDMLGDVFALRRIAIHAYVLMDNHFHLLATPPDAESLPAAMKQIGLRYSRLINRLQGRTGTLWEGRYHACLVDTDDYFLTCMRYIELNPVRAGLAATAADYRWSSHRGNVAIAADPLLTPHDLVRALGGVGYRQLFATDLPDTATAAIRTATQFGWPLGGERFTAKVESATGARATPKRAFNRRRRSAPLDV